MAASPARDAAVLFINIPLVFICTVYWWGHVPLEIKLFGYLRDGNVGVGYVD